MTIKIDKNVPMPEKKAKYPFNDLEIGDSFIIPLEPGSARSLCSNYGRKYGKKFTPKVTDEGVRVWRTE